MCICMYVWVSIYATGIFNCRHVYRQMYMYMGLYLYFYISVCIHAHMNVVRHVYMYVHTYTYYIHASIHQFVKGFMIDVPLVE